MTMLPRSARCSARGVFMRAGRSNPGRYTRGRSPLPWIVYVRRCPRLPNAPRLTSCVTRESVVRLVLEREGQARPEAGNLALFDGHVQLDDLGDTQVAQGLRRGLDGAPGRVLPGLGADPDQLGDAVHGICHAGFLHDADDDAHSGAAGGADE